MTQKKKRANDEDEEEKRNGKIHTVVGSSDYFYTCKARNFFEQ